MHQRGVLERKAEEGQGVIEPGADDEPDQLRTVGEDDPGPSQKQVSRKHPWQLRGVGELIAQRGRMDHASE